MATDEKLAEFKELEESILQELRHIEKESDDKIKVINNRIKNRIDQHQIDNILSELKEI